MSESESRSTLGAPPAAAQGVRIIGGDYNDNGPGPEVMAAETLTGDPVINAQGDELGKVSDIMVDVRRGRVAYAVMSCGGFLGIGDKLFWGFDALDMAAAFVRGDPWFDAPHWQREGAPRPGLKRS